jgi:tetratricopeptide (TPR) repeat protein
MTEHPPMEGRSRQVSRGLWLALSRTLRGVFARGGSVLTSVLRRARGRRALAAAPASPVPLIPRARSVPAHVEHVALRADDDESQAFRRLQGPGPKILDLRQAEITAPFFDRLAAAWHAAPGMVPRLAIVIDYERWVVFRNVALSRLMALTRREVKIEIVYGQLLDLGRLSAWFECGRLLHAMPAVVAWLRTEWHPTAIWPWVLDVTARMVQSTAAVEEVPHLLLEISDLAYSQEGDGVTEAAKHAHAALVWIGDAPSPARCRALRALAATAKVRGDADAAAIHLDAAVAIAMVIEDACEGAWALVDLGIHALGCRRFAEAEAAFARAARLASPEAASLRAMIHQQLSLALIPQGKHEEATRHAELAVALRWTPWAVLGSEEPALRQPLHDQDASRRAAKQSQRDS